MSQAQNETMMNPQIESLLERTGSKFRLVSLSAKRARDINAYFDNLGEGLGSRVPPQVTSTARKPLSIAFEEIAADRIVGREIDLDPAAEVTADALLGTDGSQAS
jgi:DNA-directed RNA polymerase subunit omega